MKKATNIFLLLACSFPSMAQIIGGSGTCIVSGDPNGIASLEAQDLRYDCTNVFDTLNNVHYRYDNTLTTGSRWVIDQDSDGVIDDVTGNAGDATRTIVRTEGLTSLTINIEDGDSDSDNEIQATTFDQTTNRIGLTQNAIEIDLDKMWNRNTTESAIDFNTLNEEGNYGKIILSTNSTNAPDDDGYYYKQTHNIHLAEVIFQYTTHMKVIKVYSTEIDQQELTSHIERYMIIIIYNLEVD